MKREIVFRGKRVDNGEWIEGGVCIGDNCAHIVRQITQRIKRDDYECYAVEVDPITVSQFTGLFDKNGKKIFENDALGREYTGKRIDGGKIQTNKTTAIVTFGAFLPDEYEDRNSYSWLMDGAPISNHDISGYESDNPYWKIIDGDLAYRVIGNIFDNPELVVKND